MNATLEGYLKSTLHGILNCKCTGNCLLKSMRVTEIYNDTAIVEVEPFDDAFNQNQVDETVQRIQSILLRRKESIWAMLDVNILSVTVYDEWTMKDAFVVNFKSHTITSSVN